MSNPTDWDDLSQPLEGAAEASAAEGPASPAVGRDEWVARHGERRARRGGLLGTIEQRLEVVPWWAWLTVFVGIICLLPVGFESGYVRLVAFNTVVFNGRQSTIQFNSPSDQTVRNSQYLPDGSIDPTRLTPNAAGFGAVTGARDLRSIQGQIRFTF